MIEALRESGIRLTDIIAVVAGAWLIGSGLLKSILKRTRKATIGPVSMELDSEGNPKIWELCDQRNNAMTNKVDALALKVEGHIEKYDTEHIKLSDLVFEGNRAIDKLETEVSKIGDILQRISTDYSKLSFYIKDLPDSQQLAAGLEYVAAGGNGETKRDVITFAKEHLDMYEAIIAVLPRLRLEEV